MSQTDFAYCPHCGTRLVMMARYGQQRPVCPACGFIHFRDPKVGVIALVTHNDLITRENKALVVRRAVDPAQGLWSLPGGFMDAHEMPEEALHRELFEEVGLRLQSVKLLTIFPMVVAKGPSRGIVLAYTARPADARQIDLRCDDDVSEAGWFGVHELPTELAFESTHTLLAQWRMQQIQSGNGCE